MTHTVDADRVRDDGNNVHPSAGDALHASNPALVAPQASPGIRFQLAALVVACVIPVWIAAGFLVYHSYHIKREQIDGHMLDTARAISLAVDRELGSMQTSLTVLATSPSLDSGNLAAFHQQAQTVLQNYPEGDIILADSTGQQLMNSYLPWGTPLPKRNVTDAVRAIYATGKPSITNLFKGAVTGRYLIGVDVPVVRNGRVIYDLAITLPADRLSAILAQQHLPPEWLGSLHDANYVIVARTRAAETLVGRQGKDNLPKVAEGTLEVVNLEDIRVISGFARSAVTGWAMVIAVPKSVILAELHRWLWWTIAGTALLSFLGVWLALLIAHSVARIEESLRRNREWLHVTLSSIGDAVIAADRNGHVTFLNPVAAQLTGWQAELAQGQPSHSVLQLINEKTRQPAEDVIARVLREGCTLELANHTMLLAKDGREIPIEDSAAPILDHAGKVVGVVLVFHDVTGKRRAEEALLRSEKLASVGRMAAAISHEINNPLEAVMNGLYLAKSEPNLPATARHFLDIIDAELKRIAHITRQSLGFYRESNAPAPTSIETVLDSTVDLLKSKIKSKHATIEKQWNGSVPVTAVAGELRQVFSNLLANSLDAIEDRGTVTLRVSTCSAPKNGHPCVRVTVADNGKGVTGDLHQKIFEPFITTKGTTGTGLGLWVCKQIIDKHKGTIQMRSRTDGKRRGTVFSVVLPVESASESAAVGVLSQSAGA